MFNESGVAAAHISTCVASASPNIRGGNSTDAIQYRGRPSIRAGYNLPRSAIPVFYDGASPLLHSCCPYIVSRKRRDSEKRGGWRGDPSPLLPVEMQGKRSRRCAPAVANRPDVSRRDDGNVEQFTAGDLGRSHDAPVRSVEVFDERSPVVEIG